MSKPGGTWRCARPGQKLLDRNFSTYYPSRFGDRIDIALLTQSDGVWMHRVPMVAFPYIMESHEFYRGFALATVVRL